MIFMETYNATIHNHQRTCRKVHSSAGKGCVSPCELPKKRKPHLEFHMTDFVGLVGYFIALDPKVVLPLRKMHLDFPLGTPHPVVLRRMGWILPVCVPNL